MVMVMAMASLSGIGNLDCDPTATGAAPPRAEVE